VKLRKVNSNSFGRLARYANFAPGEVAEWSIAAVLKTVEGQTSGGSNPSLSADELVAPHSRGIFYSRTRGELVRQSGRG
jgi:hypothetical protein